MQKSANPFDEISERLQRIENCLISYKQVNQPAQDPNLELPISISEASAITNLAVPTIYGLVHQGRIPSYKQGKRLYFLRSEILTWIKAGRRQTEDEIRTDAAHSLHQK